MMVATVKEIVKQETYELRHKVLWPHLPIEHCILDDDDISRHIGAFVEGKLVCTASVVIGSGYGRLRKFAILAEYRNRGIGTDVITYIIDMLRAKNIPHFWLDARARAVPFYKKMGLLVDGGRFYKEDIPYFKMSMDISLNRDHN